MKKFIIKDQNGEKEVFLGKPLDITFGDEVFTHHVKTNNLTEDLLNMLIGYRVVKEVEVAETTKEIVVPTDLNYYAAKIGKVINLNEEEATEFFEVLAQKFPYAVFSLVLKQVAIEIDRKYKDHISNSERIFGVSMINGCISEIPKSQVKNYHNFAAFRTLEDAKLACRITRPFLKEMFPRNGK